MSDSVVVPPEWVAERLGEIRIVDVREAWEYDGIGHIPGAVNVPFDRFRRETHAAESAESEDGVGMLPDVETWRDVLEDAGIAPDDTVVAYDDEHGVFAARFLVTALLYGHGLDRLHLLDGDYSAWSREHETTTEAPAIPEATYEAHRPAKSPLVDFETVREAIEGDAVIVDTRRPEEYAEGHIPGAVQLDWRELVDDQSRGLKPRDELESVLDSHGISRGARVILYCNTARRISHTFLVLEHLGCEDVAFYEGSFTEWKSRGGPLETGD